jgi:ATP-binding cassette, subfamily C, bacterial CydD
MRRRRAERVEGRLARESAAARPHFALAGVLGLATAAVVVAEATLLAGVIAGAAVRHETLATLRAPLIALACVLAARALLAGAFELSGRLASVRVMSELRRRLARQLLIDRPGLQACERTGELAAAAVQGVDALDGYFAGYLPSLVLASAVPIAVLAWLAAVDPVATAVLALTVPVLITFMILIGKGARARTTSRWRALSLLSSHFLDVVRGLETLRAHRREGAQAAILRDVGERYRRETMGTLRLAFMSALVLELCAMLGTALVAATVGVQLVDGRLTLTAGLTVLLLAPELYNPLRAVGQQFHASADGLAAAGRLLEVLDAGAPLPVPPHPREPGDPRAEPVRFERVSFAYPARPAAVLDELELELAPGEFLALLGASGAGKSTVAALALRLLDPAAGRVTCGGVDLRAVDPAVWRRRIAWVPQRARLFAGTIAGNIALAEPGAAPARIERAARDAGLAELLEALPLGLDTVVGDGGRRLSAGQAQRVALARAFLHGGGLAVLDEPTANLDAATATGIAGAIARLARRGTTLLITHDHSLAARADRVVELAGGRAREGNVRRSGGDDVPSALVAA